MASRARSARDLIALTVLALLTERPMHPYEMQRLMHTRHKDFATGKARSFYDAVNRLLRDGLVEPLETTREGKRPERTVYQITDEGREEFDAWLGELIETPATEWPVFTVAVSFLAYLTPRQAAQRLAGRAVTLEGAIAGLDTALRALQEQLHLPRLFLLEQEHTRVLRQAELEWVRALIADVRAGRLSWDHDLAWEQWHGEAPDTWIEESHDDSADTPIHRQTDT